MRTPIAIPRGIEVLVKKASVDADFKRLLLAERAGAAHEIELELTAEEVAMIESVPAAQLEAIIAQTVVAPMTRGAFLGRAAAAMLAALAGASGLAGAAGGSERAGGAAPDRPPRPPASPAPPDLQEPFVLCEETTWKGETSHSLLDRTAFAGKLLQLQRANRFLAQAHAQAARAWSADPARNGVPFPLPLPSPARCTRLVAFTDRGEGEAALRLRQADGANRAAETRKAEADRLAALSEAARDQEMKRLELVRAAQQLLDQQLNAMLASDTPPLPEQPQTEGIRPDTPVPQPAEGGTRPQRPPVSKGVGPDRPLPPVEIEPSQGIRPDRP